jgi:hypothetical protein
MKMLLGLFFFLSLARGAEAIAQPLPLQRAHAGDDHKHPRPLLDALDHGFCSVETEVLLVNGVLVVPDARGNTATERTFQRLYLEPLRERVRRNEGWVHPNRPGFILLLNLKSDPDSIWRLLEPLLIDYRDMLTEFDHDRTKPGAVTILLEGGRPAEFNARIPGRLAAVVGGMKELNGEDSVHFVPMISEDWTRTFTWTGHGTFPEDERTRLRATIQNAHTQGRVIRFSGAPDHPDCWRELHAAGADLIDSRQLSALAAFLRGQRSTP